MTYESYSFNDLTPKDKTLLLQAVVYYKRSINKLWNEAEPVARSKDGGVTKIRLTRLGKLENIIQDSLNQS
jgi:hypothetical protein